MKNSTLIVLIMLVLILTIVACGQKPTPAPTGPDVLSGFVATDEANVYINDKVTSPNIPRQVIKLKDRIITVYEDKIEESNGIAMQKYAVVAHTIADWKKKDEKTLSNLYTHEGEANRSQLDDRLLPGENAFLIIDGSGSEYSLDVYDQDMNVIEYHMQIRIGDFIMDDANDRVLMYQDIPYDGHIYEYKYKTGEIKNISDLNAKSLDVMKLYYMGVAGNDKLMLFGVKSWGREGAYQYNENMYLADINTGELTMLGFPDRTYEADFETSLGTGATPDPESKRCVITSEVKGTAYMYDWAQDKRVDIKLNDVDVAALRNRRWQTLEYVVDWKHNVLITYNVNYEGKMYCYSLETGELISTIYNKYASYAIPALDEENGVLYFYGMNGEDSEGQLALYIWDYLGLNAK